MLLYKGCLDSWKIKLRQIWDFSSIEKVAYRPQRTHKSFCTCKAGQRCGNCSRTCIFHRGICSAISYLNNYPSIAVSKNKNRMDGHAFVPEDSYIKMSSRLPLTFICSKCSKTAILWFFYYDL